MAQPARPFTATRALLAERARRRRNPFTHTDARLAEAAALRLRSTEHEEWVGVFGDEARRAEETGDGTGDAHRAAYGWWRVARYPAPTSPAKRAAYVRSQEHYLRSTRDLVPALQPVAIPFHGRPGEGSAIAAHLRRPEREGRVPIVVTWGGIDAYKEERRTDAYLSAGLATLALDMPGTADAPLAGSADAERMWDDVLDWIAGRDDLDARRVGVVGNSTGGYWAAKLSRTHRERIRAAVDHGGPVHHAFAEEWIARAEVGEYPFALAETLAAAFGGNGYGDWVRIAPRLSLLDQGVLDRASAPLLVVHGAEDTVFPVADARLLVERGGVDAIVPGGHMGSGDTTRTIVGWLRERLVG